MKWRLIEQESYSAPMNMAIEQAVYESVANGRENPTIRFYKWANNSVSIGAYQNWKDINLDVCKKHKLGVVRRMTGGRAVFHDKSDFTYSFIAPIQVFDYSIKNAYTHICSCLINALSELGAKAALENKNDIITGGKKISGNAAKAMDKGIYLQHGTLIYGLNLKLMPKVLNVPQELVKEKVTSILELKKISQKKVYEILKDNFTSGKEFNVGKLSEFELMRAKDLAKNKYSDLMLPSGTLMRNQGACYVERGS